MVRIDPHSEGSNQVSGFVWNNGAVEPRVSFTYTPDVWFHYAMTFDGTILKLYKDNEFPYSKSKSGAIDVTTNALGIGAGPSFGKLKAGSAQDDV